MLKKYLTITALSAASANLCNAAAVEVTVDTNNTIAGVVANAIMADGEGVDWSGGVLRVDLTSGSVYNGAPDSNLPQAQFWAVPGFTQLEWDTWFGVPYDGTNGTAGGCCTFIQVGPDLINMTWFNTNTTNTGQTRVANVSLTEDAQGTWSLIGSFAGGLLVQNSGVVVNGAMVPEPSALALLAVGGIALVKRK